MNNRKPNSPLNALNEVKTEAQTGESYPNPDANRDQDWAIDGYYYELPEERIAQNPAVPRDSSRLLVVDSPSNHSHHIFRDLPNLLQPGDLLVLNNTRVMPARLYGYKASGATVEVLLLEEQKNNCWLALVKPGKRLPPGAKIFFTPQKARNDQALTPQPPLPILGEGEQISPQSQTQLIPPQGEGEQEQIPPQGEGEQISPQSQTQLIPPQGEGEQEQIPPQDWGARGAEQSRPAEKTANLQATVVAKDEATGGRILQFELPEGVSLVKYLAEFGQMPLPPYIKNSQSAPEQYQTVYAERLGAVAAPTAGLHFTTELLAQLQAKGINQASVTLHVGVGTFRPVEVENITTHKMHQEWVEVSPETVAKIRATKAKGGRIIAVGTTVVRSLEAAAQGGELQPFCGKTDLFIYPGYQWRVVEGLITNFHLPRSSLLMLVGALVGRKRLLSLYQDAIAQNYRFYSFGDAMLILPTARICQ